MPNAFSPHGDSVNDIFPENQYKDTGAYYNLQIFNSWGEKIAEYNNPENGWNGTYMGKKQSEGVYIYLISWRGCDVRIRNEKGI